VSRKNLTIYLLYNIILLCAAIPYPIYLQLNMPLFIIFSASKSSYIIEENTTAVSWSKELVIEIPFNIPKRFIKNSDVTVYFEYFFDIRSKE